MLWDTSQIYCSFGHQRIDNWERRLTLFSFQEVQHLSALQTSIRFLPTVVCGILTNIATSFLVRKTSAHYLVAGSSAFSAVAGLLMAVCNPSWKFWATTFPTMFLRPMSSNGNLT